MIRTACTLLLAALLGVTTAAAQDEQNPLDRGATPAPATAGEPAWVGLFVDETGRLLVILHATADGFEGLVAHTEGQDRVRGIASGTGIEGTIGERWAFTGTVEPGGRLVLVSGRTTTRLTRAAGAVRTSAELRRLAEDWASVARDGNESAAIGTLTTIGLAQKRFRSEDREGDGALDFGTLEELVATGLVDPHLADGVRHGYRFEVRPAPTSPELVWSAAASPVEPGVSGRRYFATNRTGAIVYTTDGPFTLPDDGELPEGARRLGRDPWPPVRSELEDTPSFAVDLRRVKVGQRYTYAMTSPGAPAMQMVYEVQEVGPGHVKYTIQSLIDMGQGLSPVGEPTHTEWRHEPRPPQALPADTRRETVTVSGVTYDCWVVESGNTVSWIIVSGDVPTFPLVLKTATGGRTVMELTKVE